jgi:two-component system response regulator
LTACYELGVNSYIQKPVDFEQFREAVHTLALYWLLVNQPPPQRSLPDRTEKRA